MKYLYLCVCFLLLGGVISCVVQYFNQKTDSRKVAAYTNLVQRGKETVAEYAPEYKETTVTVMKVPVKTYTMTYSFTVNGHRYQGERVLHEPPSSLTTKVWYDPQAPSVFSTDPKASLKQEQERGTSRTVLWVAGFLAFMSLGAYGKYDDLKKKA